MNNSVPPYFFGGTAINGGAIRATLIFLFNNTSKMPNPTLVMRKTQVLRLSREPAAHFFAAELLRADEVTAMIRTFCVGCNEWRVKSRSKCGIVLRNCSQFPPRVQIPERVPGWCVQQVRGRGRLGLFAEVPNHHSFSGNERCRHSLQPQEFRGQALKTFPSQANYRKQSRLRTPQLQTTARKASTRASQSLTA